MSHAKKRYLKREHASDRNCSKRQAQLKQARNKANKFADRCLTASSLTGRICERWKKAERALKRMRRTQARVCGPRWLRET